MGIRIDGNTDLINAADGSLTIEGQSINTTGIVTASGGFKVGTAATIHSTGQLNIGVAHTIFANGNATHSGIVTASAFVGDGSGLTNAGPSLTGSTNNTVVTVTGANAIQGESNVQIDSSGRLLIGTTTEGHSNADDFTVATSANTGITIRSGTSNGGNIFFSDATSGTGEYAGMISYDHGDNIMTFATNDGTEKVRITSGGNVGITTSAVNTSQDRALTIYGTNSSELQLKAGNFGGGASGQGASLTCTFGSFFITNNNPNGDIHFQTQKSGQSTSEKMRITESGIVGINTQSSNDTSELLCLLGPSGDNATIGIKNQNTTGAGIIGFHDHDGTFKGRVQYQHNTDHMQFNTSGTERFRIASDGALTSTADNNGQLIHTFYNKADEGNATHTVEHHFNFNRTSGAMNLSGARIVAGKEREWVGAASNQDGFLAFYTCLNESPGEKMRIGSNNIFLHSTGSSGSDGRIYTNHAGPNHATLEINQNSGSGTEMMAFRNGGTQIGSITQSGSNTSYNTGSDYRLKENDVAISDGITRLKQLRPIRFNWKTDPSTTQDGFFAHEVQTIVPESVRGNKDEVFDTDGVGTQKKGGIKIQQLDHSKLVPLLTAALKEAITEIETLKTKVAALEGG